MDTCPPALAASAPTVVSGWCPLPALGVIAAVGPEAANFLHNQLTQDLVLLRDDEARFTAYCTAKGRMLASFWCWRAGPDRILLVCARDVLPMMVRRLSMFVLRAKVKLRDASDEWACRGVLGTAISTVAGATPDVARLAAVGQGYLVGLHPAGPGAGAQARALWLVPAEQSAPELPEVSAEQWDWVTVTSGVAPVGLALSEVFVPQMLNYESVGAVNFKKGCYPGQEVVARSQYRGAIKRRAMLAHSDQALAVAQEIFASVQPDQPVGQVAAVAPHPLGGWDAIVSVQTSHAGEMLHVGSAAGAPIVLGAVPYPLADI